MIENKKTIKEIADEIGVSKQAVQKRIAREPLYTCIQPYIYTIKGTKYIADEGANLIISAFAENQPTTVSIDIADNQRPDVYSDVYSEIIDLLKENINVLQKQLYTKDKQIDELNKRLEEVTSTLSTAQKSIANEQALHAGTIQKQLTDGSASEEKSNFFSRIFKRRNREAD
jgi:hypothetical protein